MGVGLAFTGAAILSCPRGAGTVHMPVAPQRPRVRTAFCWPRSLLRRCQEGPAFPKRSQLTRSPGAAAGKRAPAFLWGLRARALAARENGRCLWAGSPPRALAPLSPSRAPGEGAVAGSRAA